MMSSFTHLVAASSMARIPSPTPLRILPVTQTQRQLRSQLIMLLPLPWMILLRHKLLHQSLWMCWEMIRIRMATRSQLRCWLTEVEVRLSSMTMAHRIQSMIPLPTHRELDSLVAQTRLLIRSLTQLVIQTRQQSQSRSIMPLPPLSMMQRQLPQLHQYPSMF